MSDRSTTHAAVDDAAPDEESAAHSVSVYDGSSWHRFEVEHGRTLRTALQEHGLSPHGTLTRHLNCNGQGHCAACAVEVQEGAEPPEQWLDAFLNAQDLGRLACQIDVTEDMTVRV